MKLGTMVASKALTVVAVVGVAVGAIWYLKKSASDGLKKAGEATDSAVSKVYDNSIFGIADTLFSGMRASGNTSATSGGIVSDTKKADGIEFSWFDALNPLSSLATSGGWIWNNYFKPTPQEGNQQTSGIPLLLQKPIVFPKESQDIVDKTLEDSWFTYTGKN